MKQLITIVLFACGLLAQSSQVGFKATTGNVALVATGTTATLQVKPVNNAQIILDKIEVYCSVACQASQAANGTAATTTAGTVTARLPNSLVDALPVNFYTSSNVGAGTDQGGITNIPAGGTVVFCLSKSCGNATDITLGPSPGGPGAGTNYSLSISSITGTANITFFGRIGS